MVFEGTLLKMKSAPGEVVQYHLSVGAELVPMNELIGKHIHLHYKHEIYCIGCGRKTAKSFAQGYCFPCLKTAPETSECVLRPELCQAHEGISRDMEWSQGHCLQDHIVYFANTNGLKVGVTRLSQVPTRWIDQGAKQAVKFLQTPNRYMAGLAEVELKKHYSDKTNWRNMLLDKDPGPIDLLAIAREAAGLLPVHMKEYLLHETEITHLHYPVTRYPEKVNTLDLEKTPDVSGTLTGIKGQYLLFENGLALNIRKHNGFLVRVAV
jgi:hypothetical protein